MNALADSLARAHQAGYGHGLTIGLAVGLAAGLFVGLLVGMLAQERRRVGSPDPWPTVWDDTPEERIASTGGRNLTLHRTAP